MRITRKLINITKWEKEKLIYADKWMYRKWREREYEWRERETYICR